MTGTKYPTNFVQKIPEIRFWEQSWSNFDTQKSNFVRNCMELLLTTNMLLSTSLTRPYLTFHCCMLYSSILHKICLVVNISQKCNYSHHISRNTLTWSFLFHSIDDYEISGLMGKAWTKIRKTCYSLLRVNNESSLSKHLFYFCFWTPGRDIPIELQLIVNDCC